jgi:ketosteroid isomerase-like protein
VSDVGAIASRYIELVGAHELDAVAELLSEDVVATTTRGPSNKGEWIIALRRLLPVLQRNEIRQVVVDGDTACVVYDFITDTAAGAIPCAEWVTVGADDRITTINLLFEKTNWATVAAALG